MAERTPSQQYQMRTCKSEKSIRKFKKNQPDGKKASDTESRKWDQIFSSDLWPAFFSVYNYFVKKTLTTCN